MKGPYMEYGHGDVSNGMSDPKPVDENEFAEFMWMGEELDEFDQQVEQQLMEEFLLETCVEQMLRDEDSDEYIPPDLNIALNAEILGSSSNPGVAQDAASLASRIADLSLASGSRLNPNAPAFILNPNASVFVPRCPEPDTATVSHPADGSKSASDNKDQVAESNRPVNDKEGLNSASPDVKVELKTESENSHDGAEKVVPVTGKAASAEDALGSETNDP